MPYLKDKELRLYLNSILNAAGESLTYPGSINYFLFKFAKMSCHNYQQFRNLIGELESAKREIKRRLGKNHKLVKTIEETITKIYDELVAPYEDQKIKENGDVE